MSFDFDIPRYNIIVELDGNIAGGHFDPLVANPTPIRDLDKEKWALDNGYQMIRVLQEDVYRNKNNWEAWLTSKLDAAIARHEEGKPPLPVIVPDNPLYHSGVYARLRGRV